MKRNDYITPAISQTSIETEGAFAVNSWEVEGDTPVTPVVDEDPNNPIGDKDFAKQDPGWGVVDWNY